jgi:uncharacterized membrane protein
MLTMTRPEELRHELRSGDSGDLRRRRWIIGLSLAGIATMTPVALLQMGMVKHLPDPPLDGFDSDRVNTSKAAYALGLPDGTLAVGGYATNIPFAAFGGDDRAQSQPYAPLAAAAKAAIEAAGAAFYFYQMPAKEKAWCGYCIAGALISFAILALTIPEARRAKRNSAFL